MHGVGTRRYMAPSEAKSGAATPTRAPRWRQSRGGTIRSEPNRLEQPPAHAQKANLQGETELQLRSSAFLDDPALVGRELAEHRDLKGRYLALAEALHPGASEPRVFSQ